MPLPPEHANYLLHAIKAKVATRDLAKKEKIASAAREAAWTEQEDKFAFAPALGKAQPPPIRTPAARDANVKAQARDRAADNAGLHYLRSLGVDEKHRRGLVPGGRNREKLK